MSLIKKFFYYCKKDSFLSALEKTYRYMLKLFSNHAPQCGYDSFANLAPKKYEKTLLNIKKNCFENFDIKNPKTFNEKICWLIIHESSPQKTKLADKYLAHEFVKNTIGKKYCIPLFGVYEKFDDIDFNKLPDKFVIKCTHGCGFNIVVKDKNNFNYALANKSIAQWMKINYAFMFLELHYKNIIPKIIVEEYISNTQEGLYDYKFWCFNGNVKYIQFSAEREAELDAPMAFFDREWNLQPFVHTYPRYTKKIEKPDKLELMISLAEQLAQGFCFVRVDMYYVDNKIFFGEMTFTPLGGNCIFNPKEWDRKLGDMIELPKVLYPLP